MTKTHKAAEKRLIRRADVLARLGVSPSSLYRLAACGFPEPIKLPTGGCRWDAAEVERWIDTQAARRATGTEEDR